MKKIKINDHQTKKIAVISFILLIALIIFFWIGKVLIHRQISKKVVTVSFNENLLQDQEIEWFEQDENQISIEDIIHQNLQSAEREEIETKVVELEYETEYQNNHQLPKGMVKVLQQGQDGKQELVIRKKYEGETLISDEQIGRKITKACINKIVEVGTASYYHQHTIKVGETVYSTPYSLAIREKPEKEAEVMITINQDSKLKIKKKSNTWYYVQYGSYYGWVENDCVTYLQPNKITYNNTNTQYSKQQLLSKLNQNMNLMQPSGLTLEQFKKVLSNNRSR